MKMVSLWRNFRGRRSILLETVSLAVVLLFFLSFIKSPSDRMGLESISIEQNLLSIMNSNRIVGDASIIRCFRRYCKTPDGYDKVYPELNKSEKWNGPFKYFLIVKSVPYGNQVSKYLEDFRIQPERPSKEHSLELKYGMRIWKKIAFDENNNFNAVPLIRDINVLYGSNALQDARENWEYNKDSISYFANPVPVHLSLLKISKDEEVKLRPKLEEFANLKNHGALISRKENYKILQVSDLHFGLNDGLCYEANCKSDERTLKFMKEIIEKEKIDLVVITGDLIDLYRSIDSKSAMLKGLSPILASNIPFVFTFGESDTDEFNNPHFRDEKVHIVNFLSSLSNCYNELPPISVREKSEIHGLTNYNLKVFNLDAKDGGELSLDNPHALITVLDSQDHKIAPSQMNYLYRQNDISSSGNIFKLLFFHYPLPNFRPAGSFLLVGSYNEKHQLNSKSSAAFRDDIINCGYNVVSVGHEHQNDACLLSEDKKSGRKIWLCYNSVTGDSAKTDLIKDFDRRARIFEIDFQNQKLLSWKRGQGKGESFHYQLIHAF